MSSQSISKHGTVAFGSYGEGWSLDGVRGLSPVAQSDHGASTLCQEFDPSSDITWRRGNPLVGATVAAGTGDSQSLILTFKTKQAQAPQVGHHLWFRDGGRPNAGVLTQYSAAVSYTNCILHFMGGFGIVAQYTRGLSLSNVSAETAAGSDRYCASSADILHFSGLAGLINVTGGRFVGAQDDGVNVHGTHLQIVAQPSERNITVQFMQPESYGFEAFFAGDKIQFTRSDTLQSFGTGRVKSARMLSATGCVAGPSRTLPCQQELELEEPLLGARLKKDVVENLAFTADVSIVGAYFSRIPTRGILLSTRGKVLISNNTIHTPLRPALHIADDAASWYESGPISDVEFSGNLVVRKHNQSGSHYHMDSPPIDVAPSNTKNATVHRNLRVLNNELHLHPGSKLSVVAVKSIDGLTLTGNTIYSPGRALTPAEMVHSINSSCITVENNTVVLDRAKSAEAPLKSDDDDRGMPLAKEATGYRSYAPPRFDAEWPCAPVNLGAVMPGRSASWPVRPALAQARTCSPLDFGAVGDNATDDTLAVQRAVDSCSTVVFNAGKRFLVGAISLSNHSNLHLRFEANASAILADSPTAGFTAWCSGCVLQNISVFGEDRFSSVIDGQGCDSLPLPPCHSHSRGSHLEATLHVPCSFLSQYSWRFGWKSIVLLKKPRGTCKLKKIVVAGRFQKKKL